MAEGKDDEQGGSEGSGGSAGQRRPGRPRDPGYDKAILDATLDILNAKGYSGLSIDSVAAKSGVGRPTIYRRWPSKAALVIAALTQSRRFTPTHDTGSLRDDLQAFQKDQVRMMNLPGSRRITAGLVADLVDDPELAETYLGDYVGQRQAAVHEALRRGIERGELRPDADLEMIYDLLMGPLFMRSVVRGEMLAPEIAEHTVELVLAAFGDPKKGAKRRTS